MSYYKKYQCWWNELETGHRYRAEIWTNLGDYASAITIDATEQACSIEWATSDGNLLNPIKALTATLQLISSDTLSLLNFYSNVDESFRLDIYLEYSAAGKNLTNTSYPVTYQNQLLFTGYILQDESGEAFSDIRHTITLKASDNLGLLKDIKLDECDFSTDVFGKKTFIDIIQRCLEKTGLSLNLLAYCNIFENSTDDRTISSSKDFLKQTLIHTSIFQNSDSTWQSCYDVLTTLLGDTNCCLTQANGTWVIYRPGEYGLYGNGVVQGTKYLPDGTASAAPALTLPILVGRNRQVVPVNENQLKKYVRPYKSVKETFSYDFKDNQIFNSDLKLLGDERTSYTHVIDGITYYYHEYDLPGWILDSRYYSTPSQDIFIRVVKDASDINEISRYIVVYGVTNYYQDVALSQGLYVNKGDKLRLTFDFRMGASYTGPATVNFNMTIDNGTDPLYYLNYASAAGKDGAWLHRPISGAIPAILVFFSSAQDAGEWTTVTVESDYIPTDGYLNFWLTQAQFGGGTSHYRNIKVEFSTYIFESTQIEGNIHLQEQSTDIKNISEYDVNIDDSPRNVITGTLLTDELTTFSTPLPNNPSSDYITKTALWHRKNLSEELRLGQIITLERMRLNYAMRTTIEGSFKNVYVYGMGMISILSLFTFDTMGAWFLAENLSINLANGISNIKFAEIDKYGDEIEPDYTFNYKFP